MTLSWDEIIADIEKDAALRPDPPTPPVETDKNPVELPKLTARRKPPPSGRTRTRKKMKSPRRAAEWEWQVRYRREGWQQAQVRYFQRRFAALRLRDKLLSGDGQYAPIVELSFERRWVGEWQPDTERT